MGEPVDRARLRALAECARDDTRDESCQLRVTPGQLQLTLALDPQTVLALLDRLAVLENARTPWRLPDEHDEPLT